MKLKQQPDDFQVEELTDIKPAEQGSFAFYRLSKRGWSTADAMQAIRRRWKLSPRRLSYGGLKDRHAATVQYFTVFHGPQRKLTHQAVTVEYLGRVVAPYTSKDIRANRFRLTLRQLQAPEAATAESVLEEIRTDGVPNYFDDQRFGSVGDRQEFVARLMILERYEEALMLALAAPYEHDRGPQKKVKAILRARWGDWQACKPALPPRLADYLIHYPANFQGALEHLRPELLRLYLSAYQSNLWNRMLSRWVEQTCRAEQLLLVRLQLGAVPMYRSLNDEQRRNFMNSVLPLPSARLKVEAADPNAALIDGVLAEAGFKLADLKLNGFRDLFFSKGDRPVLCLPRQLEYRIAGDELHAGKQKLVMSFELPRGAYATLIVKRIQQAAK